MITTISARWRPAFFLFLVSFAGFAATAEFGWAQGGNSESAGYEQVFFVRMFAGRFPVPMDYDVHFPTEGPLGESLLLYMTPGSPLRMSGPHQYEIVEGQREYGVVSIGFARAIPEIESALQELNNELLERGGRNGLEVVHFARPNSRTDNDYLHTIVSDGKHYIYFAVQDWSLWQRMVDLYAEVKARQP